MAGASASSRIHLLRFSGVTSGSMAKSPTGKRTASIAVVEFMFLVAPELKSDSGVASAKTTLAWRTFLSGSCDQTHRQQVLLSPATMVIDIFGLARQPRCFLSRSPGKNGQKMPLVQESRQAQVEARTAAIAPKVRRFLLLSLAALFR